MRKLREINFVSQIFKTCKIFFKARSIKRKGCKDKTTRGEVALDLSVLLRSVMFNLL